MPFKDHDLGPGPLMGRILNVEGAKPGLIIYLTDSSPDKGQEHLLENLGRIYSDVILLFQPDRSGNFKIGEIIEQVARAMGSSEEVVLLAVGSMAPLVISNYDTFRKAGKIVFINPEFNREFASRMALIETPCLVLSSTGGREDHDPDAVKYHDLIAGSTIRYIRGVSGNPLFEKFTQSFNSLQSFLWDE